MEIKKTFTLNKGVPNLLHLSKSEVATHSVDNGLKLVISSLEILQKSIEHFSKNSIYKQISPENKNEIAIVYLEKYPLHVSYNIPTKQIMVNLFPFGTDTITNVNPEPRNIYACIAYGICFKKLLEGKVVPKINYFGPIASFITTLFVQVYGRQFGLLGRYSSNINLLKFLISIYVLVSFFGAEKNSAYKISGTTSGVNPKEYIDQLNMYDFSEILDLIKALSDFKVLPGITSFFFIKRAMTLFGMPYTLSLEDLSRFISSMMVCSIPSTSIIPRFISTKYNEDEYLKVLEISKLTFR